MDIISEARQDRDLSIACDRFGEYFYTYAKQFRYKSFKPVYQKGPTCGLTALGMYLGFDFNGIEKILQQARSSGYTKSGEMFSACSMCTLTESFTDKKVELFNGYLHCEEIVKFLADGGVMLVPYPFFTLPVACSTESS